MTGGEISARYLVVGRRAGEAGPLLLVARDRDGWSLPRIQSRAERAADVDDVAPAARATLGLEVSVLTCLFDAPARDGARRVQIYELDVHGGDVASHGEREWVGRGEAESRLRGRSEQRGAAAAWFDRADPGEPRAGREWTVPGWRDRALGWAQAQLDRAGLGAIDAVEQLRVWEWSHVLRLRTPIARLYFKARPDWGAGEPRLTAYLARLHPRAMPDLVAVEPERAWMLMRAAPGPPLMEVRDLARWTDAAAALARIQIDCVERVREIGALGCPERSLEWLAGEIDPLLDDAAAIQPPDAEALTDAQVERLRRLAPRLRAMCAELADYRVPTSIEHGDCWATNVIMSDGAPVFIDWEDASLAMPFLSARLLLRSLSFTDAVAHVPDARQRIAAAYLGPWRERGPLAGWPGERLEQAFALAQALAPLHHAVQFRRFSIPVIETSWEVRSFCPDFLRALLRALDADPPTR